MNNVAITAIKHWLRNPANFSRLVTRRPLRRYQTEPATAILDSILHNKGLTFAVMMSRQAGKNELSAQIEAYLMNMYQVRGGQIVKASPTFKPQTINSILRLTDRLNNNWNRGHWRRREGYIVELGMARCFFFSAGPNANVVGATASLLLEADEAQDIAPEKWSKDFVPMSASTAATQVMWGTAWTKSTLLAQTILALKRAEVQDGIRRVFLYPAEEVAAEVPAYASHVQREIARLGRNHPLIRTQYFLEEIDAEAGLFPPLRQALMRGGHARRHEPDPGHRYALLIDVAGEDEAAGSAIERAMAENKKRDATALKWAGDHCTSAFRRAEDRCTPALRRAEDRCTPAFRRAEDRCTPVFRRAGRCTPAFRRVRDHNQHRKAGFLPATTRHVTYPSPVAALFHTTQPLPPNK